jgi:GT2 family glycosyltransferase
MVEVASAATGQMLTRGQQFVRFPKTWVDLDDVVPRVAQALPTAVTPRQLRKPPRAGHPAPVVSVVILNRNGGRVLASMLASWHARNHEVPAELIVIDHASNDDSLATLASWQGRLDLRVVALKDNRSFSESCNRGARMARGEYVLFMNNDIEWLHDALPTLVRTLQEQPTVGVVGMKLLKVVGEGTAGPGFSSEVQHLGIRFRLSNGGYWPYEVQPEAGEHEHGPQFAPAVTGAVLLCRKADFDAVGGFDPAYFYGFEDVEFCLRIAHRLRKSVLCRNDCVALHRHGHTRLSGRESGIFDRLMHNTGVLERHVGAWIKQAYWRSLVQADGYITREPLTVGIVVDVSLHAPQRSALATDAIALGEAVRRTWPGSRVMLLEPARGWKEVHAMHVLVVGDRRYDVSTLKDARSDLLVMAWVRDEPEAWRRLPWWSEFHYALAAPDMAAPAPAAGTLGDAAATVAAGRRRGAGAPAATPVFASTPAAPLGAPMAAKWRMRTVVRVRHEAGERERAHAAMLLDHLRAHGLPCWIDEQPQDQEDAPRRKPMADIAVSLGAMARGSALRELPADCLNVVWSARPLSENRRVTVQVPVVETREMPTVAWLEQQMEAFIGRTFRPS